MNQQKKTILFFITFILTLPDFCNGQTKTLSGKKIPIGLTLDYQFIDRPSYAIGFGWVDYTKNTGKLVSNGKVVRNNIPFKRGILSELEFKPKSNDLQKDIYALKVKQNITFKFTAWGIGVGYFTDKQDYKACFIPEFGLGYHSIFLIYRRNMTLFNNNKQFDPDKNNLSVRLFIPLDKNWL